jgi:hypothetical protein
MRKALQILEGKLENGEVSGNRWRDVLKLIILLMIWMTAFLVMGLSGRLPLVRARAPENEWEEDYYRKKREDRNKNDVQREQEMAE